MSQSLSQLRKFVSPEIIFGAGCRHNVGNYAKTFGARKVLVVANGLAKAKAVKAVVSGPVTPECPGSILQLHPDCTLVADEEALSLL